MKRKDKMKIAVNSENDNSQNPTRFEVIENYSPDIFKQRHYSTCMFKDGARLNANVEEVTGIMLDFDKDITIEQFKESYKDYEWILITSRSHQKWKKDNPPCDRFHVIFPTGPFKPWSGYRQWVYSQFPKCDVACNPLGFLYAHPESLVEFNSGKKWEIPANPPQQVIIPEIVDTTQVKVGERNNHIFKKSRESIKKHGTGDGDYNKAFEEVLEENKNLLSPLSEREVQSTFESALTNYIPHHVLRVEKTEKELVIERACQEFYKYLKTTPFWGRIQASKDNKLVRFKDKVAVYFKDNNIVYDSYLNVWLKDGKKISREDVSLGVRRTYRDIPKNIVEEAMETERTEISSIDTFLKTEWDGEERVENFLINWFKVKPEYHEYAKQYSRFMFASLYKRIANKEGNIPYFFLFQGQQGTGKDLLFKTIAPYGRYASAPYSCLRDNKDIVYNCRGNYIIHFSELMGRGKTETEAFKLAIAANEFQAALKYEGEKRFPVTWLWCGSTNEEYGTTDTTGDRRSLIFHLDNKYKEMTDFAKQYADIFNKDAHNLAIELRKQLMAEVAVWSDLHTIQAPAMPQQIQEEFKDASTWPHIDFIYRLEEWIQEPSKHNTWRMAHRLPMLEKEADNYGKKIILSSDIQSSYAAWCKEMGQQAYHPNNLLRQLKLHGFISNNARIDKRMCRYWEKTDSEGSGCADRIPENNKELQNLEAANLF